MGDEKNRAKAPEGVASLVERVFGTMAGGRALPASIALAWRRVVGDQVAERSVPVRMRRNTLHVRVATSAWLNELQMLSPMIIQKLRKEADCPELEQLRLEVGRVEGRAAPSPREVSPKPRPTVPITPEMKDALGRVQDPELRAHLDRVLTRRRS